MKTVRELSDEHGIDRSTLLKAARDRRIPARQSGTTWLIDDESELFKHWLLSRKRKSLHTAQLGAVFLLPHGILLSESE